MNSPRPRRSALYLPCSNLRALAKARTLDCDIVILDLEDAVAPAAKPEARSAAVTAIGAGGFGGRELVVRVNALATEWGEADLTALAAARPDAVLIPKVDDGASLAPYAERASGVPLWAMVETARAVLRLESIAAADGLAVMVMGTNDLAKELRANPGPERLPLLGFLAQAVAAARAHGRVILDGVCNAIDDPERFAHECAQGAAFGFDGKTLIHPNQIAPCNAAFGPGADAIGWAERVVAAFAAPEAAGKGAIRLEGAMVERLHLAQAEQLLAVAGEATRRDDTIEGIRNRSLGPENR